MIGKQFFLDILVVLSVPVLVLGAYVIGFRDTNGALFSEGNSLLITQPDEPGATTKAALEKLNSITLNDSLFKDQAFLSLITYTVPIPESELSRDYPFSPTDEISEMLKRAKKNSTKTSPSDSKAESLSVKLDLLKSSVTK